MQVFKTLEQITSFESYKKLIKPALGKVGSAPEKFHYVERFKFDKKNGPLLLIGEVPKDVLENVKKAGGSPIVSGKVKEDAGKLAFSSSAFNADKMKVALKAVDVAMEPVKGTLSADEEAVGADKDKRAEELEALRANSASVVGKSLEAKAKLTESLKATGRATGDQEKREEFTGKILQGMEKTLNDRRKEEDPSRPLAHGVSAHGKGTDQVTRLVSGRRADEIVDETAKGKTPPARVSLFGNPKLPNQEMPAYTTVGEDASNVSGAFATNVGMMHVIEEAYAQAAQLDSYIAAELKQQYEEQMEAVRTNPAVEAIASKLRAARTLVKDAQTKLKITKEKGPAQKLVQEIQKQEGLIKGLGEQLRSKIESVKATLDSERAPQPNDRRAAFNVKDDGNNPEGLGRGLKIEDGDNPAELPDKPGAVLNSKAPGKTNEQVMQDRFSKIKQTDPIKSATVVMDPSYTTDADGKKRRTGWDVQTAFPSGRTPDAPLQDKTNAKQFVDQSREDMRVQALKEKAKLATEAYEKAKADQERLTNQIQVTKANQKFWAKALEAAQKKFDQAEKSLADAKKLNSPSTIVDATKLLEQARVALEKEKLKPTLLAQSEAELIKATAAEAKAKLAMDKAVAELPAS